MSSIAIKREFFTSVLALIAAKPLDNLVPGQIEIILMMVGGALRVGVALPRSIRTWLWGLPPEELSLALDVCRRHLTDPMPMIDAPMPMIDAVDASGVLEESMLEYEVQRRDHAENVIAAARQTCGDLLTSLKLLEDAVAELDARLARRSPRYVC